MQSDQRALKILLVGLEELFQVNLSLAQWTVQRRKSRVLLFFETPAEVLDRQRRDVRLDDVVVQWPRSTSFGNGMTNVKNGTNLFFRDPLEDLQQIPERRSHVFSTGMVLVNRGHTRLSIQCRQFLELWLEFLHLWQD